MKRIVAVVVLVVFLPNCVVRSQQKSYAPQEKEYPIVPSKQAGEVIVIDAEKRKELGLFPEIERFEEARFTVASSGGYEVEVVTEGNVFSGINNDTVAVAVLCDYLANYDQYRVSRETFEKKWKIVAYDELGFPITSYEARSVKNRAMPCICGGGCLLLGAVPIALLTMVIGGGSPSGEGDMNWTAGSLVIISGVAGSILAGSALGNKISNHGAVKKIKESRKLKTVEKL